MGKKADKIRELEERVAYLESILGVNFQQDVFRGVPEDDFEQTISQMVEDAERLMRDDHPYSRNIKKQTCRHSKKDWTESYPPGAGYCKACVREEYENAGSCPHCGITYGFDMAIGDCCCEVDPE